MTKHFVEVIDPYERHTRRTKPKFDNVNPVCVGEEPTCDYTEDQWESMMEYYYAYEYTPKSR